MKIKLPKKLQKTIQDKDIVDYEFEEDNKLIKSCYLKDDFINDCFYVGEVMVEFAIDNDRVGDLYGYVDFKDCTMIVTDNFPYVTKKELKNQYSKCVKELIKQYKEFIKSFFEEKK